jgi:hypothetical protein
MNNKTSYLAILLTLSSSPTFIVAQTQNRNNTDTLLRYGIYNATAYYSGNGRSTVTQQTFMGSDLLLMLKAIDSSRNGAIVSIDNVRFVDSAGRSYAIDDITAAFNNGKIFFSYTNPGELNFEKIKTLDFISGVVYFSGTGFPNSLAINAGDSNVLQKCYEKSMSGTTITFESCVYKNQNGVSSIVSKTIKL